jgi:MFS family permease
MVFLNGAAVFTMWFFVSLYLQQVLRLSAVQTGIAFVPMALGYVAACTVAPRLVTRLGFGRLVALGMIVSSVGLVLLAGVQPTGSYFVHVLPGGVLAAFGSGLAIVPSTIVGVQGVRREQSGLASGLINTSRLMGGALGLAVLSTIAAARTRAQILSGIATVPATNAGYRLAFIAGALILAVGSAGALVLLRRSVLADASPPEVLDVAAEEAGAAGTSLVA